MPSPTLRTLAGADETPAALADATLILVDYQNTYTRGVMELTGWRPALDNAAALLAAAREAGTTVIHVQHDGGEGSHYDIRTDLGAIHPAVAPVDGEAVVVKGAPNSFVGTELGELVDAAGHTDVIVIGFMTHMCVTFTAEGAALRGNRPTVVADACATRPLATAVAEVTPEQLHASALATIADAYGVVVPTAAHLK
ncbi:MULTISPECIES: isochorismatase family protein [Glycomyces]|uniref:Isochorismatase family protein n=2 Tax=Glycomyces TaxID=58113 RepID=A0A9X3PPY0_9ACTN|nr:isochorismatase family protein [Glycomyces lechevalierae]MDA1387956.1 isochorismatase family protein [Glycomyces lechevalierae]MDR7339131.1 nicotinamidase-related amidase [Glycomyces lechevalierae]